DAFPFMSGRFDASQFIDMFFLHLNHPSREYRRYDGQGTYHFREFAWRREVRRKAMADHDHNPILGL
ncbi:hypothetical protein ACC704_38450, partial [Rhizobium johnstonii]|uniref:hypothetical protein n=1 Tax=Rhizobium johnstonii TaxID=3019933 RepID=UPI003F9B56D6